MQDKVTEAVTSSLVPKCFQKATRSMRPFAFVNVVELYVSVQQRDMCEPCMDTPGWRDLEARDR